MTQATTFLGKPITVGMLHSAIEESVHLEMVLGAVAQELNEALGLQSEEAVVQAARRAVELIRQANLNVPLHKPQPMTEQDATWHSHLMRGTFPGDPNGGCNCSFCSSATGPMSSR